MAPVCTVYGASDCCCSTLSRPRHCRKIDQKCHREQTPESELPDSFYILPPDEECCSWRLFILFLYLVLATPFNESIQLPHSLFNFYGER